LSPVADLLPESTWAVATFDGSGEGLVEPRAESELTIELQADDRLEGDSGCGTYFGAYDLDGDSITFHVVALGRSSCAPQVDRDAVDFTQTLEAVRTWRPSDTGVELLDDAGGVRVIISAVTSGVDGAWQVTAYARPNGRLQAGPVDGSMSIALEADGTFRGATGCRLFEGEYITATDDMLIVPLDFSGLPCEGDTRQAERRLLAAMERVVLWEREGSRLRLTDANGATLIEMTAAAPVASASPSALPAE
jgi:heat shock protein HslJ